MIGLDVGDRARFRFPDDLRARVVYDFALGYHYDIVHREHLLKSLVPLSLGRTAAFVLETQSVARRPPQARLARVGLGCERQKPYLVERWR